MGFEIWNSQMLDSVVFYKSHISVGRSVFHNFMGRRCENIIVAWVFTFFMGSTITGKKGGVSTANIYCSVCLPYLFIVNENHNHRLSWKWTVGWSYRVTFRLKNPFGAFHRNILWIFCQIQDETQLHPRRLFHVFFPISHEKDL